MNENIVNGYMVVRSPDQSGYHGADREPWEIISARYYTHELPPNIQRLYEEIDSIDERGFWWPTSRTREDAECMLAYTREYDPTAELIAIYSPYLFRLHRRSWTEHDASFLGFDVVPVGEWSLLRELTANTSLPDSIRALLNSNKLLYDETMADVVEAYYRDVSGQPGVEPIGDKDSGLPVEAVRVYKLKS